MHIERQYKELEQIEEVRVYNVGNIDLFNEVPKVQEPETIPLLNIIKYVQSDRLNINYFKNDRSVMWDLAPHDVSMIAHVYTD